MATKDTLGFNSGLSADAGVGLTIGIVKAKWNSEITDKLAEGAIETLKKYGAKIVYAEVPGTVELTFGAKKLITEDAFIDAVIILGCVIQGETRHFDYVCDSVTYGMTKLNLQYDTPVIFGVLTTQTKEQALDRAGGKLGNKGEECAIAAIEMSRLKSTTL